jgi:hypothetical protein
MRSGDVAGLAQQARGGESGRKKEEVAELSSAEPSWPRAPLTELLHFRRSWRTPPRASEPPPATVSSFHKCAERASSRVAQRSDVLAVVRRRSRGLNYMAHDGSGEERIGN